MPPAGPLPEHQIKLIQAWIDQGAPWPDELSRVRSSFPADATVEQMRIALKSGKRTQFQRLVKAHPESLNAKGQDGWTALMYAALYGNVGDCRLLVDRGAVVNARNDAGGTALMYAVHDLAKAKLLLARGADPNLRSGEGRTALMIAAGNSGSFPVVKLLLERGADVKQSLADGRGALALSATSLDPRVLRLLLDHGAASPVPLSAAVFSSCQECVAILLPHARPRDLSAALRTATSVGNIEAIQKLLDAGAQAPPTILRAAALSPKPIPATIIRTFLGRGADPNVKTSFGLTTVDFTKRQGNDAFLKVLAEAGIREESPAPVIPVPKPAASVRAAVQRAIAPLQRSDVAFLDRAGCVSCHNNSLTAMMVSEARARGFGINEEIASKQLKRIAAFLEDNSERALENEGLPGGIDTISYILLGMAAEKYPSDTVTDIWARYAKNSQSPDGSFKCTTTRPPLESSDFQVTAATIRSLLAYAPASYRREYRTAVERAVRWLAAAEAGEHRGSRVSDTRIEMGWEQPHHDPEVRREIAEAATLRRWVGTGSGPLRPMHMRRAKRCWRYGNQAS
jgi:ankyrin repeat protein